MTHRPADTVRRLQAALVGSGLFALFFWPALSPSAVVVRRDTYQFFLPLKEFAADELRRGHLPTWYPYDGIGVPYIGSAVAGLFHPLTLLLYVLSPAQALKWQLLTAYPVAALGMALLLRTLGLRGAPVWLGALGYGLAGYLLSMSDNLPYLLSASTLPWALATAERLARRPSALRAGALALALAFALLGGDAQAFLLQALLAALLVARARIGGVRRWVALGLALVASGLLLAPLLTPMYVAFLESARAHGLPDVQTLRWSLHPARLFELVYGPPYPLEIIVGLPKMLNRLGAMFGSFWAPTEFVGTPLVALALVAASHRTPKRIRIYLALAPLFLVLAFGRYGEAYLVLMRVVPFVRAFRYPEKLMPVVLVALAVLAAFGARRAMAGSRRAVMVLAIGAVLSLGLALLARPGLIGGWLPDADPDDLPQVVASARSHALLGALLLGLIAVATRTRPRLAGWTAVALNFAQVWLISGWAFAIGGPQWASERSPFEARIAHELPEGQRRFCYHVAQYDWREDPDLPVERIVELANARTMLAGFPYRARAASTRAYLPGALSYQIERCDEEPLCATDCSRFLGAPLGMVAPGEWDELHAKQPQLVELERIDAPYAVLFRDPGARPFATLPRARYVATEAEARRLLDPPDRDFVHEVVLVGGERTLPAAQGTVSPVRPSSDRLQAEVDLTAPGLVVLAESCASGWHGTLDGRPVKLERADLLFCAAQVPAGKHQLVLDYTPPGWPWAFLGPVAAVGLLGASRRRLG